MSFPFEHIQYLGVGIPQDGPVFLDIDVCHLHVPVHVAEAVVDEALIHSCLVGNAGPTVTCTVQGKPFIKANPLSEMP